MKKVSLNTHSKCPDFRRRKKQNKTKTIMGTKAIDFAFGSENRKAGGKKCKIFQSRLLRSSVQKAFSNRKPNNG